MGSVVKVAITLMMAFILVGQDAYASPDRGSSTNYTRPSFDDDDSDYEADDGYYGGDGDGSASSEEGDDSASSEIVDDESDENLFNFTSNNTKPVALSKVRWSVQRGDKIGKVSISSFCIGFEDLTWRGSRGDLDLDDFQSVFTEELNRAGFNSAVDNSALFNDNGGSSAEILVAASIRKIDLKLCGTESSIRGKEEARLNVDWHIFSVLDRKVVAVVNTKSKAMKKRKLDGDIYGILIDAFAHAQQALMKTPQFQRAVANQGEMLVSHETDLKQTTLFLSLGQAKTVRHVADFSKTVGIVLVPGGHGSGFFITSEGHMLTNEHVVGKAKFVKVKMNNGEEFLAEVLRRDTLRDVALIKVATKPKWIVSMSRVEPRVGDEVYAVGAPLQTSLNATVTKGIVSAKRLIDRQRFLQADAAISGGNSGGPMFNAEGKVVAMSTASYADGQNLNLFGTINDLLNALAIEIQ